MQEIFTLADQRKAAAQSKEIQKRGGEKNLITNFALKTYYNFNFANFVQRIRIPTASCPPNF